MNHSNGLDFLFLLLLPVLAFLLYRFQAHRTAKHAARAGQAKLPLTRHQLYRIALQPYVHRCSLAFFPIAVLLMAACIAGRMRIAATLISVAGVAAFIIFISLPVIRSQCLPLIPLTRIPDFDKLLAGKQLYWLNGAWGYADDEWFIRASGEHCAVLKAGMIDFNIPVKQKHDRMGSMSFRSGRVTLNLYFLTLTGKDGKTITACSQADPNIRNWILIHGGKIIST